MVAEENHSDVDSDSYSDLFFDYYSCFHNDRILNLPLPLLIE